MMETPRYVLAGDPIPPEFLTAAGFNRLLGTIEELRAVLAPLLANPWHDGVDCVFCGVVYDPNPDVHEPTCPVLRRDEILGRLTD